MSELRQAALVLHGLSDTDRSWMLGQLLPHQAETVGGLLAELRELGIPRDPSLAAQALAAQGVKPIRTRPPTPANDPAEAVCSASTAQLHRVLEGESHGFVVVLLAAGEWPWRAAYLEMQEPARRRALMDRIAVDTSGPRLREQVLGAVARRVRETGTIAPIRTLPGKSVTLRHFGALISPMLKRGRP